MAPTMSRSMSPICRLGRTRRANTVCARSTEHSRESVSFMVGAIDLSDPKVETPQTVAERVRRALKHVSPERVIIAPDCGMKYLPRETAFAKMQAMVKGAELLRAEYAER